MSTNVLSISADFTLSSVADLSVFIGWKHESYYLDLFPQMLQLRLIHKIINSKLNLQTTLLTS